ncbi:MAG: hypothetical protein SFU99_06280 [Saprospiraceae bacterium]|nr:hypothetical protein [Saprospiraceae bacterium]
MFLIEFQKWDTVLILQITAYLLAGFIIYQSLKSWSVARRYRAVMLGEDKVVVKNYSLKKIFIPQRTIELWRRWLAAPLQWIFGSAHYSYFDIALLYTFIMLSAISVRFLLQMI